VKVFKTRRCSSHAPPDQELPYKLQCHVFKLTQCYELVTAEFRVWEQLHLSEF